MTHAHHMMEATMNLTEKVLSYQRGETDWNSVFSELYTHTKTYVRKKGLSEDDSHELFYAVLGRLRKMVLAFKSSGRCFEVYLKTCLSYYIRTYRKQCAVLRIKEEQAGSVHTMMQAHETADSYEQSGLQTVAGKQSVLTLTANQKRIVITALRNCLNLNDERCLLVSRAVGVHSDWLASCRDSLRATIHTQYSCKKELFDRRIADRVQAIALHGKQIPEVRRIRLYPKHVDIAYVLGIPKGTVDSIMHACRKMAATMVD